MNLDLNSVKMENVDPSDNNDKQKVRYITGKTMGQWPTETTLIETSDYGNNVEVQNYLMN